MSSTGEAVFGALSADPTVAGLVVKRIYPSLLVEGSLLPAIVYSVVSDVPQSSLDGTVATRLANARVQVDCYARHYLDAQTLADAVDAVLGALALPTLSAWRESRRDLFDNETQYHRVSADYSIWR